MSLIASSDLYEAIRADVVAAWAPDSVSFGLPQMEPAAYPFAAISLGAVAYEADGPTTVQQTYEFGCVFLDQWGTDPDWNVELAKECAANALIARLMANPVYAASGLMPQIVSVAFDESDDPVQPTYYVTVTFSVVRIVRAVGS